MYEESILRKNLGTLAIISSIGIGIYTESFLWGIGAFIIINLIVAPIIKYFE